jgi:hypothetical protein
MFESYSFYNETKILENIEKNGFDDFNGSYVDRCLIGFHLIPKTFYSFDGPSKFEGNDWFEARSAFINKVQNHFHDIYQSLLVLRPQDNNPKVMVNFIHLWKGITQLLRETIIQPLSEIIMVSTQDDISFITTSVEVVSGIARGLKHWPEKSVKIVIETIILPMCESLIHSKNIEILSLTETMFQMICADRDFRRQIWLIDFLKKCFGKFSFSTLIDIIGISFIEFRSSFAKFFDELILEYILPKLNLSDFSPNELQSLSSLFFARNVIGTSSFVDNSIFINILFVKIFDQEIQSSPGKLVEFLHGLFSSSPISVELLESHIPRIS